MILNAAGLIAALAAAPGGDAGVLNDRMGVVGTDVLSAVTVDYCRETAPAKTAAVEAAYRKWRTEAQVDAVRADLGSEGVARIEAAIAPKRESMWQTMAGLGAPDTVCAQAPATWTQTSFNVRANYPRAYPAGQVAQASAPAAKAPVPTVKTPAVKPGNGLKEAQIEAVVSSWYQGYYGTQFTLFEKSYLVLKDGSVRKGLPEVGPGDFDLAADRAAEPNLWGQWQKTGTRYAFRFPGDSKFTTPENDQVEARSPAGLRLDNSYHASSGYQIIGGAGSFSFRSLALRGDGRFTRSSHGFVGGSTGFGDAAVVAGNTWDDKGSATTITGPGAAMRGGGSRKTGVTDADLQGTYRIEGYELVLTFDSGRRESHFFHVSANKQMIGLGDETMLIKKD
ncbi:MULTISPECIES: hypothetical protein [Asticcacaulis]|uniref:hypothetical protein n=1 Tax=Asticcacaulis TaxID=76890 RepID=UPI001AE423C1|nr:MULTISPECIES: hypothetical protein [Asticcacaulis]MBP2158824.1 hypothetical protein [Asticcacaulis solisilvae]MDR6799870.1 hypothetical protein [Asticcacaulis sp. BE141]